MRLHCATGDDDVLFSTHAGAIRTTYPDVGARSCGQPGSFRAKRNVVGSVVRSVSGYARRYERNLRGDDNGVRYVSDWVYAAMWRLARIEPCVMSMRLPLVQTLLSR